MGQGQGPQTKVGSGVGDAVQTKFCKVLAGIIIPEGKRHTNRMNDLMDHYF
jgi:hypothetical protein